MSDILKSGDKFAKQQGIDAAREPKHTTITLEGEKAEDGPGSITVGIKTEHEGEHVTVSAGGWFRRVFKPGGSSAGLKGEIKF